MVAYKYEWHESEANATNLVAIKETDSKMHCEPFSWRAEQINFRNQVTQIVPYIIALHN